MTAPPTSGGAHRWGNRPPSTRVVPLLALVGVGAACSSPVTLRAPALADDAPAPAEAMVRALRRAAAERELDSRDALAPGLRARLRAARLAAGALDDYRDEGARLFALDTPWDTAPAALATPLPAVRPTHARDGAPTADATRCLGCHHVGGAGGSGSFADLALFDADGDDVLSARRRLPPMLAGAALLELAARGDPTRHPYGRAPGRPRRFAELVRWSVSTHLGVRASDDELAALALYLALLPPPVELAPRRASLVARSARGAAVFDAIGCTTCHVPSLPVADPVIAIDARRRLDLSTRLSADGLPPFAVAAYSDLRPHHLGAALRDASPPAGPREDAWDPTHPAPPRAGAGARAGAARWADAGAPSPLRTGSPGSAASPGAGDGSDVDDAWITTPLWGVASRGPYLHDGRASTLDEAVLAHGGEARASRDRYVALDGDERASLTLFLLTLTRPPALELVQ